MKKIIVLVLVLSLCSLGCACKRTNSTTGVTTANLGNCFANITGPAQTMVCNPPAAVVNIVSIAIPILGSMVGMDATFALGVCKSIQTIGCTSLTALNRLIDFFNSPSFQQAFAQTQAAKLKAVPFDVQPLVDWSHKAK